MSKVAILFGVFLIALGMYGYFGSTPKTKPSTVFAGNDVAEKSTASEPVKRSFTAMIPAAVGLLLAIYGMVGLQPERRKDAMHAAAGVALLGFLAGGVRFLMKLPALLNGDPNLNQRALMFSGLMGLICMAYLILSIRSFIAARKQKSG